MLRIDPMSQPAYTPKPHVPPRDRGALRPIWQRILEAIKVSPDTGIALAERLGVTPKKLSGELSEMKARGLVVALGDRPAIWEIAPPGMPAPVDPPRRRANTGLRARVRELLLERPRTVTDLLEHLPDARTRSTLIDNLRKWRDERGCYLHRVGNDLLVSLPDQPVVLPAEAPCPSPPAPAAPPSTRTATRSPAPTSAPPAPGASAGTPSPTAAAPPPPSSPTAAPASGPRTPEPDLPSLNEQTLDPALRPLVDAYWALQRAVDDYVEERLRADPAWRALALAIDEIETAIAERRSQSRERA
jgi:hypothetical protein